MATLADELLAEVKERRALTMSSLVEQLATLAAFDVNAFDDPQIGAVARYFCEPARGPINRNVVMLSSRPRIEAIANILERGRKPELASVRDTVEPFEQSPLQEMLDAFTLGRSQGALAELSDDHLVAALTVARWVGEAVALARLSHEIEVGFDTDELEGLLAQRDVTRPVREVASQGCVAREPELEKLRQYLRAPGSGSLSGDPALLVYGIGGVGKSMLVATFVMELIEGVEEAERYVWAYLDMDRPTLRTYRPEVILDEILRQVGALLPGGRRELEGARQQVAQKSAGSGLESAYGDEVTYATLANLTDAVRSSSGHPLVVVLDTFEEVEHSEPELRHEIYRMFERLSSQLPLKLIVSGRAPAEPFASLDHGPDRRLEVKEFEGAQALALLRHFLSSYPNPVQIDDKLGMEIVETVGGSPLTLKLAASVLATERSEHLVEAMGRAKAVDQVRREFIRGFLYQRIIEHLQATDPARTETLQLVARASLPLRHVTPDLIREVVLPAIGVENEDAQWLHEELVRTVAFVSKEDNRFWLRVEVRVPALRALGYADKDLVDRVHRLAIEFYTKRSTDPGALIELAFHGLELGMPTDDLKLEASALEGLKQWVSRPEVAIPDSGGAESVGNEEVTHRLEQMYKIRQAVVLAEQSLGTGQFETARSTLDDLDQDEIEDLEHLDPRLSLELAWLDSRVYEAQENLTTALSKAHRARELAVRIGDRVRYAAISIWIASLEEFAAQSEAAVTALREAIDSSFLVGDHRLRLELLLNQLTTMERLAMLEEDDRWLLELQARELLGLLTPGAVADDTALLRLLAATLGRDEPARLKAALAPVGLGFQQDPELLKNLARSIASWDQRRKEPLSLARSVGVAVNETRSPDAAWVAALTGMGPEAGYRLDSMWVTEEPPLDVREAIRAFYLWWERKRAGQELQTGSSPNEGRPHFLDETPIDFGREEVQALEQIVVDGYGKPEQLLRLADLTGIDPASLILSARPRVMVRAFMNTVGEQGRLRDLMRVMGEDTSLGTLRVRVNEMMDVSNLRSEGTK